MVAEICVTRCLLKCQFVWRHAACRFQLRVVSQELQEVKELAGSHGEPLTAPGTQEVLDQLQAACQPLLRTLSRPEKQQQLVVTLADRAERAEAEAGAAYVRRSESIHSFHNYLILADCLRRGNAEGQQMAYSHDASCQPDRHAPCMQGGSRFRWTGCRPLRGMYPRHLAVLLPSAWRCSQSCSF
jgi:hypothetical protein